MNEELRLTIQALLEEIESLLASRERPSNSAGVSKSLSIIRHKNLNGYNKILGHLDENMRQPYDQRANTRALDDMVEELYVLLKDHSNFDQGLSARFSSSQKR